MYDNVCLERIYVVKLVMSFRKSLFIVILMILNSFVNVFGKEKMLTNDAVYALDHKANDDCNGNDNWERAYHQSKVIQHVCIQKDYQKFKPPNARVPIALVIYDLGTTLTEINEERKTLSLDIQLLLHWEDSRIQGKFLDEMDVHMLPPILKDGTSLIWSPGTEIENLRKLTFLNDPIKFNWVFLSPAVNSGFNPNSTIVNVYIEWHVEISCTFDFSTYPFDDQGCGFRILLWDSNIIHVRSGDNPLGDNSLLSDKAIQTHGFEVWKYSINGTHHPWPGTVFSFGKFGYDIKIRRMFKPYVYQYYIPCALIVIASCLSFIIPISAIPGRVGLVVTQFLTLTNLFINQKVCLETFQIRQDIITKNINSI